MASTRNARRPGRAARRFGYAVALLVNLALIGAVNVWPGWESVPFLTPRAAEVIGWVNASLAAGVAVNVIYLAADPPALRALGDLLTAAIGLVPMVLLWRLFPFHFPAAQSWDVVARVLLAVGIFGAGVGMVAALVALVRALGTPAGRS